MDNPLELLVIDDDAIDRMVIIRALRSSERPVAVTEAEHYAGAMACLSARSFDLVLLDYHLPDSDGLSVVQAIRGMGLRIPIVMLTGQGDERVAVALLKAGATDYLTKGELTPERLLQTIGAALRLHAAERRAEAALHEGIERLRFQSESSQILGASLDPLTVLANLARHVGARLADWCAIRLLAPDGGYETAGLYPDSAGLPWCAAIVEQLGFGRPAAIDRSPIERGEALVLPPLAEHGRASAEEMAWLAGGHVGSLACAPIIGYGQTIGSITLVRRPERPTFSYAELVLIQDLAQRLAVALHNAQLYQQSVAALRLRDEFISLAAHELRTPLTGMLGYVQLLDRRLSRDYQLDERESRMLRTLVEQGVLLNEKVKRLLDLSQIKAGAFTLERRPLDLAAALSAVVALQRETLEDHTLDLALPEGPCYILGDPGRLDQAFEHLLQNAVKYSPGGGRIAVRATIFDQWAHVVVQDGGIGIPPEAIPQIFRRFYRAKNADDQAIGGIGLGLYIVNEIITLHGGVIEVQSTIGQGSSFTVRLPLLSVA